MSLFLSSEFSIHDTLVKKISPSSLTKMDAKSVCPEVSELNGWEEELSNSEEPHGVMLYKETAKKTMSILKKYFSIHMNRVSPMDMQKCRMRQVMKLTNKLMELRLTMGLKPESSADSAPNQLALRVNHRHRISL